MGRAYGPVENAPEYVDRSEGALGSLEALHGATVCLKVGQM